jgi:hypothetical protein
LQHYLELGQAGPMSDIATDTMCHFSEWRSPSTHMTHLQTSGLSPFSIQSKVRTSYRPTFICWGYENCIGKATTFKWRWSDTDGSSSASCIAENIPLSADTQSSVSMEQVHRKAPSNMLDVRFLQRSLRRASCVVRQESADISEQPIACICFLPGFLQGPVFDLEDGDGKFLRSVGELLPSYSVTTHTIVPFISITFFKLFTDCWCPLIYFVTCSQYRN